MKYLTLVKYGVIAAVLIGIGVWLGGYPARLKYDRLQQDYSAFQIRVAHERQAAQKAATDALEAQIAARNATEANNAKVISSLQAQADHAAADRDYAVRLLAAAREAASQPASGPVPQAQSGQRTPDPAAPRGDRSLVADLGDAVGECRDAIDRLTALQNEIRPQL